SHADALSRLPTAFSQRFGYRASPVPPQPNHIIWIWSFILSYFANKARVPLLCLISHLMNTTEIVLHVALALLIYGVLDGPLAQPCALVGGHVLSAILGTTISKVFLLLPPDRFTSLQFLASSESLSTATSIVLMQMTGTSHPPAGATALIPILDDRVRALGWDYVWMVLLTSTVMGAVAMATNNVRRWPVWWICLPAPVPGTLVWPAVGGKEVGKLEKKETATTTMGTGGSAVTPARDPTLFSLLRDDGEHTEPKEEV
ncbi:HPP family-domain-containing protein, partial [Coprinopsis sp. MPI-PUGE-AT-0042]